MQNKRRYFRKIDYSESSIAQKSSTNHQWWWKFWRKNEPPGFKCFGASSVCERSEYYLNVRFWSLPKFFSIIKLYCYLICVSKNFHAGDPSFFYRKLYDRKTYRKRFLVSSTVDQTKNAKTMFLDRYYDTKTWG